MWNSISVILRSLLAVGFLIATMPCLCEAMEGMSAPKMICHLESDHDSDHGACGHGNCGSSSFHHCMNQKADAVHCGFSNSMKVISKVQPAQMVQKSGPFTNYVVPSSSPPQTSSGISILRI